MALLLKVDPCRSKIGTVLVSGRFVLLSGLQHKNGKGGVLSRSPKKLLNENNLTATLCKPIIPGSGPPKGHKGMGGLA